MRLVAVTGKGSAPAGGGSGGRRLDPKGIFGERSVPGVLGEEGFPGR